MARSYRLVKGGAEENARGPRPYDAAVGHAGPGAFLVARNTAAPTSGTTPATTRAPRRPHVPAARPSPHGPRSCARSDPVADAALAVGFFDQSHFTNRVRQTYGMTPRTFQLGWGGA